MFHHHLNIASFLWGLLKLFSAVFKNQNKNKNLVDHKSLFDASPLKAAVALLVLQSVSVLETLFYWILCEQEWIMVLSVAVP